MNFTSLSRKQWTKVTVMFLMFVFGFYFIFFVIKPVQRFEQSRDASRLTTVNSLKSAIETYVVTYKSIPSCESIGSDICPVSYVLDGEDPVSKKLIASNSLPSIPKQPLGTSNPFCEYRVFIYSKEEDKYYLRWCMESWNEQRVLSGQQENNEYCSWLGIGNIALCLTGKEIPLVQL